MPSRQGRRRAERDAAKRAPARTEPSGVVSVNPLGDWTTQADYHEELFQEVGEEVLKQMAAAGDGAAQFSLGCRLMSEAGGYTGFMGAAGRSQIADVGLALAAHAFRVAHQHRLNFMFALPGHSSPPD